MAKLFWSLEHGTEHFSDLRVQGSEFGMLIRIGVAAVFGEIEGAVGFIAFAITVGELRDKMIHVATFRPRFSQVQTYRP